MQRLPSGFVEFEKRVINAEERLGLLGKARISARKGFVRFSSALRHLPRWALIAAIAFTVSTFIVIVSGLNGAGQKDQTEVNAGSTPAEPLSASPQSGPVTLR